MTRTPALASLLSAVRQHPGFPSLLQSVPAPQAPRFKTSSDEKVPVYTARAIFSDGARIQHDAWLQFLSGN